MCFILYQWNYESLLHKELSQISQLEKRSQDPFVFRSSLQSSDSITRSTQKYVGHTRRIKENKDKIKRIIW